MLQPTFRNVVMTKCEQEEKTGMIYMVSHTDAYDVVAVGPDVENISVGDKVILRERKPEKYEINNEYFYVEHEKEIIAVVK